MDTIEAERRTFASLVCAVEAPRWSRVESFHVRAVDGDAAHNFLPDGHAGLPEQAFTFGGAVALYGNVPLVNAAAPTHPLKYRFRIAEWGWPAGDDGAAKVPGLPPPPPTECSPA